MGLLQPTAIFYAYSILGHEWPWHCPLLQTHGWLGRSYIPLRH
jgi:hypothetical protein